MDQEKDIFNEFLQDMLYICRKAQYYDDEAQRKYDNIEFKEKYKLQEENEDLNKQRSEIIERLNKTGVIKFTLFNTYQELQDLQKNPNKNQKE